jgi:dUTP pyrophosphatase
MISIKIVNNSNNKTPNLATKGSAGADIRAFIENKIILKPMERKLISTGLKVEIPFGYEVQIRPRSGLAFKNGITVINSPGTIDSDYRGEIGVLLVNLSSESFEINNGDRIAQMVLSKYEIPNFIETSQISVSQRGKDGFGSTGKK